MANNFCSFLSNGLFISDKKNFNKLNFSPCGIYKNSVTNYDEINWKKINDWTDNCKICNKRELDGKNKSLRYLSKDIYSDANNEELIYLDINYSNACNAACVMCNSRYSSSIARIEKLEKKQNVLTPNVKQETFLNFIKELNLDNLKVLKLMGGEPFYIDFHKKLLKLIKNPSNVEVIYQTNGSIYPDQEWWELASNFKTINIIFSVDGIKEKFEYIRTNLNYKQVEDNILKISSNNKIKLKTSIHYTVNPLNAYYFDEIFYLLKKMKQCNKSTTLDWDVSTGIWDLSNLTPNLREKIISKYKNKLFSNVLNSLPFDIKLYNNFKKSIILHEKRFNKNGLEIFPEIYEDVINY